MLDEGKLSKFNRLPVNKFIGRIDVKNVLTGHIWIIFIFLLTLLLLVWLKSNALIIVSLLLLLLFILVFYMYTYIYFMKTDPDYLRSETYSLEKHKLEMGGSKFKEKSLELISEDMPISLPNGKKVKKKLLT
ncbi:hypothetical protein A2954_06570 [Candidatus Roizmanbacteria bacterium RIFCSPLOWO2_01_FULL_37_12]|uniref:Uncharacterized protein n=1 Tax=Candidatus Roizmanbacteria bacterium RIFCSPLOWO2_01_FULL_37_12 TaxID=1802056 RepID=A0A1F7I8P2_9BACT|nr:MAG: hypothetical protein A2768_00160 [Candidatus Roizmanbacteria bacterium RIFCSPHIGHO2_01_FULL_37_16]OGK39672.1 MAG: hypothetical protein A2954_06570 [Candidatus Roizmanbacteria bacterium RIFCSPLOWO2_01_FULL_37_12]